MRSLAQIIATDTDPDELENSDVPDHKLSPALKSCTWYNLFRDVNLCPIPATT